MVGQPEQPLLFGPAQARGGLLGGQPHEGVVLVVEHRVGGEFGGKGGRVVFECYCVCVLVCYCTGARVT